MTFTPKDVDLENGLCSTFGKSEIETAACDLVRFFQETNRQWKDWFKFTELAAFYERNKLNPNDMLFGLMGAWFDDGPMRFQDDRGYVINWGNGLAVTKDFLDRIEKHVRK